VSGPTTRRTIDLNADLGEEVTDDPALLALVTSANVPCGYHAGTRVTMRAVCAEAARTVRRALTEAGLELVAPW